MGWGKSIVLAFQEVKILTAEHAEIAEEVRGRSKSKTSTTEYTEVHGGKPLAARCVQKAACLRAFYFALLVVLWTGKSEVPTRDTLASAKAVTRSRADWS